MVVDRPTPFERLSFLPSLFSSLSLSLSLFLSQDFFVNTTIRLQTMDGGGGGVISIHFFWFFSKSNSTNINAKLFVKQKKKRREKNAKHLFSYNSCVRSRTLLPHRDRHAVRSAPTVRDYRRRHHCHWWHPICRARFTHG